MCRVMVFTYSAFSQKPPAYDRQGVTDDLIDFTQSFEKRLRRWHAGTKWGQFLRHPWLAILMGHGTLMAPATGGGTNWPGGSYDRN